MLTRSEDTSDRRNKLIYLTAKGKALQAQLHPWVTEVYGVAVTDVPGAGLGESLLIVKKMIANVKSASL